MKRSVNKTKKKNVKTGLMIVIAVFVLAALAGIVWADAASFKDSSVQASPAGQSEPVVEKAAASGGDIVIDKSKITGKAVFFPYQSGDVKMEVLAVKAPDETIRTAMNTCQVCYASGAGYYIQEGEELVCQNCGNRFHISKVEKIRNGCNPVPVTGGDKTEDEKTITIKASFMDANKDLFANWKR